ncbi:inositol monophosphatase family protein [Actinosynnema sp. CS-041913]|uniref:inositol monophosphatase family protein n=1 Tax=Actinosynnema sp. CS-041913 TaxID=3239917 RepID=UPI003D8D273C
MKRPLDELTKVARQAVSIGNDLIKSTRPQKISEKSDRDTYTDVDVRIEHEVRSFLKKKTPEIGFLGEEEGANTDNVNNKYVWILDPIDGTANFVHGIPLCATQIALVHHNKAVVAAVSLPHMDMHYWAAHGTGAFLNGNRINVSETKKLSKAIVSIGDYATGIDAKIKNRRRISLTASLAEQVERVRMFGSAAHDLVWLADGRTDAAIILSNNPWDTLAGVLIARESGAKVFDTTNSSHSSSSQNTIASTKGIADELLDLISRS